MNSESITETLCTQCGLCCDGSIFDDVELADEAEAAPLEVLGLEIEYDDPPSLLLPCKALRGKRCTIYPHRPGCCRTFECRLLEKVKQGSIDIKQAEETIARTLDHADGIKALCRGLGETEDDLPLKERCIEVLSQPCAADDDLANSLRGELAAAMDAMGILLQAHFLGEESGEVVALETKP